MASEIIQGFGVNRGDKDDRLDRVLIGLDELDTVIPDDASGEAIIILRDAIRTLVDEVRDIRGGLVSSSDFEPRADSAPAASPQPRSVPVDPDQPNIGTMEF